MTREELIEQVLHYANAAGFDYVEEDLENMSTQELFEILQEYKEDEETLF